MAGQGSGNTLCKMQLFRGGGGNLCVFPTVSGIGKQGNPVRFSNTFREGSAQNAGNTLCKIATAHSCFK